LLTQNRDEGNDDKKPDEIETKQNSPKKDEPKKEDSNEKSDDGGKYSVLNESRIRRHKRMVL
jgi:hypothetical protein